MPDSQTTEVILEVLREIRKELAAVRGEIRQLSSHGCAQLPGQMRQLSDHESRLRANELYIHRQAGQIATIGSVGGVGGGIMALIGRWLLKDIGG